MRVGVLLLLVLLAGCARDVVLKPAALQFSADAGTAVAAATVQYDGAIAMVNADIGQFLASNPECGLSDPIVRRDVLMAQSPEVAELLRREGHRQDSVCLTAAERASIDRAGLNLPTQKLPFVARRDFAPQFQALLLVSDYVAFLAEHADGPDAGAAAQIQSLSAAMQDFSGGLSDLVAAGGGNSSAPNLFAAGGPAAQFLDGFGVIAGLVQDIAGNAQDVRALEARIRTDTPRVQAAIAGLARNADQWSCASHISHRNRFAALTEEWNRDFAALPPAERAAIAERWVAMRTMPASGACAALTKVPPPEPQSTVGQMFAALGAAAGDLNRIAERDYTPAERQRMVEATLSRLGAIMQAVAKVATPLF